MAVDNRNRLVLTLLTTQEIRRALALTERGGVLPDGEVRYPEAFRQTTPAKWEILGAFGFAPSPRFFLAFVKRCGNKTQVRTSKALVEAMAKLSRQSLLGREGFLRALRLPCCASIVLVAAV